MSELETYFDQYRKNIVGIDSVIETPYGIRKLIYADWIASGRLYSQIEKRISDDIGPLVGNTHSESTSTGKAMTDAYHHAQKIVKRHVNANDNDILLFTGTGMTSAIAKLQRLLGLKAPEQAIKFCAHAPGNYNSCKEIPNDKRPVVFLTHTEHHSNHTSWFETLADVVVLEPSADLKVNPDMLRKEIVKFKDRPLLIGSFSSCSNVTGYFPPYYELAKIMHELGGYCFVDFAASAPYVDIDMHPANKMEQLDAIFFSPHKFLGGPGSAGVLIFKTALAVTLKEKMGIKQMHDRESELIELTFRELSGIKNLHILAPDITDRLGVFSFFVDNIHHNLFTILLNDYFGIQVRGGCSCAGTYGHFFLNVDIKMSKEITDRIDAGDLSMKPGWIRLSLHPTMTDDELLFIVHAIKETAEKADQWKKDYCYDKHTNEFNHSGFSGKTASAYSDWFKLT